MLKITGFILLSGNSQSQARILKTTNEEPVMMSIQSAVLVTICPIEMPPWRIG